MRNYNQYWIPVNLDKREFISPHHLGCGLKLWEQLANPPGVGAALIVLQACMPVARGGGDFDLDENWHGPERTFPEHNCSPGPMPEEYRAIAARTIGRWAGDRVVLVGDYSQDSDLPSSPIPFSQLYGRCCNWEDVKEYAEKEGIKQEELFRDVSPDVAAVIEHELRGKFVGDGWRNWMTGKQLERHEAGEVDDYGRLTQKAGLRSASTGARKMARLEAKLAELKKQLYLRQSVLKEQNALNKKIEVQLSPFYRGEI